MGRQKAGTTCYVPIISVVMDQAPKRKDCAPKAYLSSSDFSSLVIKDRHEESKAKILSKCYGNQFGQMALITASYGCVQAA